jgi:hypothetical protein
MFLLGRTMHCNIVSNTDCSRVFLKDKTHLLLKDILTYTQPERETGECESAKGAVESGKVR